MSADARILKLAVCAVPEGDAEAGSVAAIAAAAAQGADLVLLPEQPEVVARWHTGQAVPRHPLDEHPLYRAYADAAARHHIAVIGNLYVTAGDGAANTSFILDRDGRRLGCYRKLHPAPGEANDTTPLNGDPFPLFTVAGARLGLAVCMDIHVPEVFRIYGLKGADLICVSTQYMDYTGDMLESLEKARAIDSQVYFALSRYIQEPFLAGRSMGYAKVIAPDGRIICSTAHRAGVATAALDLDARPRHWNAPHATLREIFDRIRQPSLYRALTDAHGEPPT
jgi:nitrilase